MPAIEQQTWDAVQGLTWGDLDPHFVMDFRLALLEGAAEVQAKGIDLSIGQATSEGIGEAWIQGINVEFSPIISQGQVEVVVSCSVAKRDYKKEMLKALPGYYYRSKVMSNLLDADTKELRRLEFELDTLQDSLFVDSVVKNVDRWELDLGITPDVSKPYDFRREKVKAKLRSVGTTTKAMIETVAAAFSNGEVSVVEDNANYVFKVKFTGTKGTPSNMADLSAIIEEIKPAHLAFAYDYTYNTWSFIGTKTWQDVSTLTWAGAQTFN